MLDDKLTIFYFNYLLNNFWSIMGVFILQKSYKSSYFKFQNREIE